MSHWMLRAACRIVCCKLHVAFVQVRLLGLAGSIESILGRAIDAPAAAAVANALRLLEAIGALDAQQATLTNQYSTAGGDACVRLFVCACL